MERNKKLISEIGKELRRIRKQKGKSMQDIAEQSDVTSMYISEIERNRKIPSDELIDKLSVLYSVNNVDMYEGFKKIPEKVENEIIENSILFELLYKLATNPQKEKKKEFYLNIYAQYDKLFE